MGPTILHHEPQIPSNWRGAQMAERDDWIYRLAPPEVADLERALEVARRTGQPRSEITRQDFPLAVLAPAIASWMAELESGRGFLNVKGLPVAGRSQTDAELLLWGLGLHMGTAVSQNTAGDLLGHVRDTGADAGDPTVRLYKTRAPLGFHSDGADLVALLCLRQGRSGGATRLVSSQALYGEILRRRPDLVPLLYEPFCFDAHGQELPGQKPWFELPICRVSDGRILFFYIPWYIRNAQRHPEVPRLTPAQIELLDLIDETAADPALHLEMKLEPGEVNLLKNDTALHARTEYVDFDEPDRKRQLLRLWLTAHGEWSGRHALVQQGIPTKAGTEPDAAALSPPGSRQPRPAGSPRHDEGCCPRPTR